MKGFLTISFILLFGLNAIHAQDFTDEEKAIIERGAQLKVEAFIKKVKNALYSIYGKMGDKMISIISASCCR